jgi:uncharacterized membrane protein
MNKLCATLILTLMLVTALNANPGFRSDTVNWLDKHHVSQEWTVIIISMLPVVELRGSIPVAMFAFHFGWFKAAALSVVGNMLPIPLVLLFWESLVLVLHKSKRGARFIDWLYKRTKSKSKVIEKYEAIGLAIFVGIPLPGTGAWTGAFAANIFGLRFWKSLFYIFLGVLLAACAVTILCQTGVIVMAK